MTWKQIGENQVPKPGPVSYFQQMKWHFTRLDYHLQSAGQSNILYIFKKMKIKEWKVWSETDGAGLSQSGAKLKPTAITW